jgi:hypothetical protein
VTVSREVGDEPLYRLVGNLSSLMLFVANNYIPTAAAERFVLCLQRQ